MMWRRPAVSAATTTAAVLVAGLAVAQDVYRKDLKSGIDAHSPGAELFLRAFEVFSHPRCSNCHPRDDRPRQGTSTRHIHAMNVQRGEEKTGGDAAGGYGRPGMECRTCHQEANGMLPGSPPGAHNWRLAPKEMGWDGLTAIELCVHLHDLADRGVKIFDHILGSNDNKKIDPLVAWAWKPGPGREAAPGELKDFVEILTWWKEARAPCPPR
jgi:hypothetical protein